MKSLTSLVLGLVTSFLLTLGFVRSAAQFDPLDAVPAANHHGELRSAVFCVTPTHVV